MRPDLRLVAAAGIFLTSLPVLADSQNAVAYSDRHGGQALIIWKDGRTVLETFRLGSSLQRDVNVYSITKSLSALAVLQAAGRGKLSLDERVSETLADWQNDGRKRNITVRDLLDQTSGLATGFDVLYANGLRNRAAAAIRMPSVAAPGSIFAYGPSHYEALEVFVAKKLKRPSASIMDQGILRPLGIRADAWRRDRTETPYFSAGAHLSAKDLLAIGHLVRRSGWHGIFPVVAPALMHKATSGSNANAMYGLGFWLNHNAHKPDAIERDIEEAISAGLTRDQWSRSCVSKAAPGDLVIMAGSRGQRVYVSRSQNLVIVRTGNRFGFRDPEFLNAYFRKR
jgi:CubicO group peptidase (beta-lactamase class C family)